MNIFIEDVDIDDFSDLLVSLPMFKDLNNTADLKNLFGTVLRDLYKVIPEEVLNFLRNTPSKQFLTLYFMQMGIDDKTTKAIPDDYKTKIIYVLYQLFEVRGTVQTYKYLAQILEDITGDMNFYNIRVEESNEYKDAKFQVPNINKIEYLEHDQAILAGFTNTLTYSMYSYVNLFNINSITGEVSLSTKGAAFMNTTGNTLPLIEVKVTDGMVDTFGELHILTGVSTNTPVLHFENIIDVASLPAVGNYTAGLVLCTVVAVKQTNGDMDGYRPIQEYYSKGYDKVEPSLTISFDYKRMKKITTVKLRVKAWYPLKFTLSPTDEQIALGDTRNREILLPSLQLSGVYEEDLSIFDSQKHGTKALVYKLKPVYIMDQKNILTSIDSDFSTRKYFMLLEQFIQRKTRDAKKNIFPVDTNVLYIQYNSGENLFDTMKVYPDLVRMYAMTALQNETFYINIGNYSARIPLNDYMDILSYIKIEELSYKNPGYDFNTQVSRFDAVNNKQVPIDTYFSYFQYPMSTLPIIDDLIKNYSDFIIDTKNVFVLDDHQNNILKRISPYEQFNSFKSSFQSLLSTQENIKLNNIFNKKDFHDKLSGNKPATITDLIVMVTGYIKDAYPTDSILQTKLINELVFIQNEWGLDDADVDSYISLLINYSITNYELFKQRVTTKYPRLIQEIEKIKTIAAYVDPNVIGDVPVGAKAYFYIFLQLYKQIEPDIVKSNDNIKYFFRDTFSRLIMGNTFKNEFFDPIINLFENYFFNVDQSYMNSDIQTYRIKDKMNFIPVDSRIKHTLDVPHFSKNLELDSQYRLGIVQQIYENRHSLTDDVTLSITRDGQPIDITLVETKPIIP